MTAEQFIADLEKQGLLPGNVISMLRRIVEDAPQPPPPAALAKLLVDNGQLTPFQAKKLLGEAEAKHAPKKPSSDHPVAKTLSPPKNKPAEDDLGLTPLDDSGGLMPLNEPDLLAPLTDDLGLAPLDEPKKVASPAAKSPAKAPPQQSPAAAQKSSAKAPAAKASSPGLAPLDAGEGLAPLDGPAGLSPLGGPAPLDDLLGDPLLASSAATAGSPLLPSTKPKSFFESLFGGGGGAAAKGPASPWESPLILLGGGSLVLLVIVGVVLYFTISRGSAQDAFDLAEKDYSDGAYTQAIAKYERFVSHFPADKNASLARVRIGMSQLRNATSGKNWSEALRVAGEALPPLEVEESFAAARPELVTLLPDIMAGFAEQAAAATDLAQAKELLAQAREAEKLVNNPVYLPSSERKNAEARILQLQGKLSEVEIVLLRDEDLTKALADLQTATAAGETAKAYDIRRSLLRKHPILTSDEKLQAAVRAISIKERDKVRAIAEPLAAMTDDHPQTAATRVTISSRRGETLAEATGYVVPVLAGGSVVGVDAAGGVVRWRRPVGGETLVAPQLLSSNKGADILAADARKQELLRLAAADGKLVWRLPVGDEFFRPVISGERIYLSTRTGRVLVVDAPTGQVLKQSQLPQPAAAEPALNSAATTLYVVAEHTNFYTLAADSLICSDVTYTGHSLGAIVAPPAMVLGHLVAAENLDSEVSRLRVFAADKDAPFAETIDPLRLKGQVLSPPVVIGKQMIWFTDRGEVQVYEVLPGDAKKPLRPVANLVASLSHSVYPYPLVDGTRIWLGGMGVSRNELQSTSGKLVRRLALDEKDAIDGPLMLVNGEVLISIRRRAGLPGITVAATRVAAVPNSAVETAHNWETQLAVPLAGPPQALAEQRKIALATALGEVYELSTAELQAGLVDQPAHRVPGEASVRVTGSIELDAARRALAIRAPLGDGAPAGLLIYDPAQSTGQLSRLPLPAVGLAANCPPAAWGEGIVAPLATGQVVFLNPLSGESLAAPYQPPIEPGTPFVWQRLAASADSPTEFVAADGEGKVYRLAIQPAPSKHLASQATAELPLRAGSPLAIVGATLWGLGGDDKETTLLPIAWPGLTAGEPVALSGPPLWGPSRVGDAALVATADELLCLDSGGKMRWQIAFDQGGLAGPPTDVENGFLLALTGGVVRQVSSAKGETQQEVKLGETLSSGAALFNGRVLVMTADGTMLMAPWK